MYSLCRAFNRKIELSASEQFIALDKKKENHEFDVTLETIKKLEQSEDLSSLEAVISEMTRSFHRRYLASLELLIFDATVPDSFILSITNNIGIFLCAVLAGSALLAIHTYMESNAYCSLQKYFQNKFSEAQKEEFQLEGEAYLSWLSPEEVSTIERKRKNEFILTKLVTKLGYKEIVALMRKVRERMKHTTSTAVQESSEVTNALALQVQGAAE